MGAEQLSVGGDQIKRMAPRKEILPRLPFPEINVTESTREDFRRGTVAFFDSLLIDKPQVLVVPYRSGVLAKEGVESAALELGAEMPEAVAVRIGREIPGAFRAENKRNLHLDPSFFDSEELAAYGSWLDRRFVEDKTLQLAVNRIVAALSEDNSVTNIEIFDDCVDQGGMQLTTLWTITKALEIKGCLPSGAFGQLDAENIAQLHRRLGNRSGRDYASSDIIIPRQEGETIIIHRRYLFEGDWRRGFLEGFSTALKGRLRGLDRTTVERLVDELSRGKMGPNGDDIVPYDNWDEVVKIGEVIREQEGYETENGRIQLRNPASILERYFERERLLKLFLDMQEGFKKLGTEVGKDLSEGRLSGNPSPA